METMTFIVDSKLLRELGERLVGRQHIALGELIKNSYDADATTVEIEFGEGNGGTITVKDDGCGMTLKEFKDYWMRIGSAHKESWMHSQRFKRPLTGRKGIGRLAVQMLAEDLELITTSKKRKRQQLRISLCWADARDAGELTRAKVDYEIRDGDFEPGTTVRLINLNHGWSQGDFRELALELWRLVPPFRGFKSAEGPFEIDFKSYDEKAIEGFKGRMKAFLRNYEARVYGKNRNGSVRATLEYHAEKPKTFDYTLDDIPTLKALDEKPQLIDGEFEIRIYRLRGRQRFGLLVDDVREYMHKHSGVHIYDSGFHMPYYGDPFNDWLGILSEHSRRLGGSALLPKGARTTDGLTFMPSLARVMGVVRIDTGIEPDLHMAITRDRLVETNSYVALREMIRYALHWYAMETKRRKRRKDHRKKEIEFEDSSVRFEKIGEVLEYYKPRIPHKVFEPLSEKIQDAVKSEDEAKRSRLSLMGAFATAGVSSLAYQHEIEKQLGSIEDVADEIGKMAKRSRSLRPELERMRGDLKAWSKRARSLNALFSHFQDTGSFEVRERFKAKTVVEDVHDQVESLMRDCDVETDGLSEDLLLPRASMAEWISIFQNVMINAYNAMADSVAKTIEIMDRKVGDELEILIQDTGCGVDLEESEELFKPFMRKVEIPPEKMALGYGGTGIGLTIVRMISNRIGCKVSFAKPTEGYNTAFSLTWRE